MPAASGGPGLASRTPTESFRLSGRCQSLLSLPPWQSRCGAIPSMVERSAEKSELTLVAVATCLVPDGDLFEWTGGRFHAAGTQSCEGIHEKKKSRRRMSSRDEATWCHAGRVRANGASECTGRFEISGEMQDGCSACSLPIAHPLHLICAASTCRPAHLRSPHCWARLSLDSADLEVRRSPILRPPTPR